MRKIFNKYLVLISLCLGFWTFPIEAKDEQVSAADINNAVQRFLLTQDISGRAKIDSLVSMPFCDKGLDVAPYRGQLTTVTVGCVGLNSWQLILGVKKSRPAKTKARRLSASSKRVLVDNKVRKKSKIKTSSDVWVATKTLRSGMVLSHDNVGLRPWYGSLSQGFMGKNSPLGRELKRNITEGQAVRERHLVVAWDIEKGQEAILKSRIGTINVITNVISMENAFIGQRVKVINEDSNKQMLAYLQKTDIFSLQPLKTFPRGR